MWSDGAVMQLLVSRELGEAGAAARVQHRLLATRPLVDRLGLEAELRGHDGCVNCLEWNTDGSVLASASDDLRVILWDALRRRRLRDINTGHIGNIFSVKFVSSRRVATCAADCTVRVHDACAGDAPQLVCACHRARVKRLASPPHDPQLLWSAGEDGLVLQHDLRAPHSCGVSNNNVLVQLTTHAGRFAEAKCLAASPTRPHQLAVGANDFYVRLYDTRMIKLTARTGEGVVERREGDTDGVTRQAAKYFAPGHLSLETEVQSFPKMATTYLAFSPDGNELLVNLGSEQVYVFDVVGSPRPLLVEKYMLHEDGAGPTFPAPPSSTSSLLHSQHLPPHVAAIKEAANKYVHGGKYAEAVALYSEAIAASPRCAVLYSNRATALLRRAWAGDVYAAVRDCHAAIALDSTHVKSHFRLAKALMELRRPREAHSALLYFNRKFPEHANSHAVHLLARDIAVALESSHMDTGAAEGQGEGLSSLETALRAEAADYSQRFLGHCNVTTDIKEASFVGAGYIAAGSDDGALLLWARASGRLVRALRADESILNCVQPHPSCFLLATSGIESVVRLWGPRPDDGSAREREAGSPVRVAAANQLRMRADPFESMLLNVSGPRDLHELPCRPS